MKNIGHRMQGLSLHYYTVKEWGEGKKGFATQFTNDEYYWTIGKCLEIEEVLQKHMSIMDKYDKNKRIGLMVDEWGTWFNVEPGTNSRISISAKYHERCLCCCIIIEYF